MPTQAGTLRRSWPSSAAGNAAMSRSRSSLKVLRSTLSSVIRVESSACVCLLACSAE